MSEFMEGKGYVDTGVNTGTVQVDDFSRELNEFLSDDNFTNKEDISNVLKTNSDLKNGFEEFLKKANSLLKIKCKKKLQSCNTEDEIKSVIAEVIPEGFRVGNGVSVVEETVENDVENRLNSIAEQADDRVNQAGEDERTMENRIQMVREEENRLLDYRTQLLVGHDDVRRITEDKAKLAQQQLPEETRNQLKEKGYDDNFINDYILLRVTLNEVRGNLDFDKNQVLQFESGVNELSTLDVILKRLDNACNIPDTSLSSFSGENIAQTRTELFNDDSGVGNESLKTAKNSNIETHKGEYKKMFQMGDEDIFKKYGHFLEGDSKKCWDEYKNDYLGFLAKINSINVKNSQGEELTTEDKALLSIEGTIKGIKERMDNDTKNIVEELCIISQIKGMYMCMGEGDDFNLNKANEIQSENGVLTLKGHIDGVDFAIRQDTNDPNARLQTSQKLVKSEDGNTFTIGGKDRFVDSNFILPSQDEIFQLAVESVNSDGILDGASDINEYQELLQEEFMKKADELYKDTKYVHHYMKNQVKGEKIIDDSLGLISKINPSILNNKTLLDSINQSTNKDLYDFLKILNFNIENSTDYEKDKLIKCIDVIQNIPTLYKERMNGVNNIQSNYPPIIKNYLENQAWISDGNENSKLKLVYDLFSKYNEYSMEQRSSERSDYNQSKEGTEGVSSKIIINDLYRDLVEFTTSGQSEVAVRWENENKEQQDRQDAKNIEKAIENMPDGDWS